MIAILIVALFAALVYIIMASLTGSWIVSTVAAILVLLGGFGEVSRRR